MREIFRSNGFVIETNDSNEVFVKADRPNADVTLRISRHDSSDQLELSYLNQDTEMVPYDYKTLRFKRS